MQIDQKQRYTRLVKKFDGIASFPISISDPDALPDWGEVLDVAQWESDELECECNGTSDAPCSPGFMLWGTSEKWGPKICSAHFFDAEASGIGFVAVDDDFKPIRIFDHASVVAVLNADSSN